MTEEELAPPHSSKQQGLEDTTQSCHCLRVKILIFFKWPPEASALLVPPSGSFPQGQGTMEGGTDYLVGRAVSQIWSACKREASTPALVHLSLCALLLLFPPAWGLDGQLSGIWEGKTGSVAKFPNYSGEAMFVPHLKPRPPPRGPAHHSRANQLL